MWDVVILSAELLPFPPPVERVEPVAEYVSMATSHNGVHFIALTLQKKSREKLREKVVHEDAGNIDKSVF